MVDSKKNGKTPSTAKLRGVFRRLLAPALVVANLIAIFFLNHRKLAFLVPFVTLMLGAVVYLTIRRQRNLPLLIELFPFVGKLIAHDKQNKQNLDEAIRLRTILQRYKLWKFEDRFTEELAKSVPVDESYTVGYYAKIIAGKLDPNMVAVFEQIVLLIYESSTGTSKPDRWSTNKAMVAQKLALILLQSGQITSGPRGRSLETEELAQLLLKLDDFSKYSINDVVTNFGSIWKYANNYLQFLSDHQIAPPDTAAEPNVLLYLVSNKNFSLARVDLDAVCFDVLVAIGEPWLSKELGQRGKLLVDSFVLISIAIFVINRDKDKHEWQEKACRRVAGMNSGPSILLAYLEFAREAEGDRAETIDIADGDPGKPEDEGEPVTLKYLIENWREKNKELKGLPHIGYQLELSRIKNDLINGEWPKALLRHIRRTFMEAATGSPVSEIIEKNPWLQQALKRVFEMVSPETIKRFLRARTVSPYFITFSAGSWHVRPLLKDLEPKYNFKQYTDNVRIGVVPKKWSFDRLCREFHKDFDELVSKQQKSLPSDNPGDLELILHQFDLSPQNYYGFVKPNVTKEEAIEKLQRLFGDMLSSEELLGMIEYQGDMPLAKMLIEAPISELIASLGDLPQDAKDVIEDRSSELQAILKTVIVPFVQEPNSHDVAQHFLQADQEKKDRITEALGKELYRVLSGDIPSLNQSRFRGIARDYLETIAAIVSIDSAQAEGNG